ncbi:MAG: accessory Sec system protein Asp2, partial [Clostridium sp.]
MKVTAYVSEEIARHIKNNEDYTVIENQGIIPLLNDISLMDEICNDKDAFKYLKDIEIDGDYFVFDIFSEVEDLVRYKKKFFVDSLYKKELLKKNFKPSKRERIYRENIEEEFFEEAYIVFLNKIIRQVHLKRVFLLDIRINNESNLDEVNEINMLLERYCKIIKKISPGINIININLKKIDIGFKLDKINLTELITDTVECIKIFKGERIFPSRYPIKYCFQSAKLMNKDKLIVSFSSFSSKEPKYNYKTTLELIDCNKLFILDDYCEKGSYYIGMDGEFNIENSVFSLICNIASINEIKFKNIISIGTSKGGTAALYYGIKYNFGNVIVGAPQYSIGSYLSDLSIKRYANQIFGKVTEANRVKYDNLIRISYQDTFYGEIRIITSEGDKQYKKVLKEIEYLAEEYKVNLHLSKCDIREHSEISKVFPKYLIENLNQILNYTTIRPTSIFNMKNLISNIIKLLRKR